MPQYPKEQIWKIYENLPEELKEAIFSEETAESIDNVCQRSGIKETEKISQIAKLTGHVLLGLLLPEEFQQALEKEVGLKSELAKKVSFGIHRFVFFPLRESLSALYQTEIATPGMPKPPEAITGKETSQKEDVYREPVE